MDRAGCYKGTPMAAHPKRRAQLLPAMFERWLAPWHDATVAEMPEMAPLLRIVPASGASRMPA